MENETEPMPDNNSKRIIAIDSISVHKICSGQVITNLSSAIKELVENSLDAGSTNIGIKLKKKGLEGFSVEDNGDGIEEENFERIALKHNTSKISDFNDLSLLNSFGFRGEALSSLCAVGDVCIKTRHKSVSVGSEIRFDNFGKVSKISNISCPKGTTVYIEKLFNCLPVRRKELERNIRKDYSDMLNKISAYGLISDAKITIINFTNNGKQEKDLDTLGRLSDGNMLKNITRIFSLEQASKLIPIKQHCITDEIANDFGLRSIDINEANTKIIISGYVSSTEFGSGRSTTDRQFIFINKRPCDFKKITKLINEVYHSINRNQYPFFSLSIIIPTELIDVNVSPDKRQLIVNNEKFILAVIKSSLVKMFSSSTIILSTDSPNNFMKHVLSKSHTFPENTPKDTESTFTVPFALEKAIQVAKGHKQLTLNSFINTSDDEIDEVLENLNKKRKIENCTINNKNGILDKNKVNLETIEIEAKQNNKKITQPRENISHQFAKKALQNPSTENMTVTLIRDINTPIISQKQRKDSINSTEYLDKSITTVTHYDIPEENINSKLNEKINSNQNQSKRINHNTSDQFPLDKSFEDAYSLRTRKTVNFSISKIKKSLFSMNKHSQSVPKWDRKFRSKIDESNNENAEIELRKEFKKEDFPNMNIIGQFNKGFIVVELNRNLFIIDQHASDEKYNFEMLQQNLKLNSQPLLNPKPLNFTPSNENILIDNIKLFETNGFRFEVDELEIPGKKVKLLNKLFKNDWEFGKEDIDEMICMISDSQDGKCQPSRIYKMNASKACRMSIMIGTSLSYNQMKEVVSKMGETEQPWHCPHGRPTMRYLKYIESINEDEAAKYN